MAVEPEQLQLFPVVQLLQHWVPDPTDKAVLHSLQSVDTALVGARPQLAAAIQPGCMRQRSSVIMTPRPRCRKEQRTQPAMRDPAATA